MSTRTVSTSKGRPVRGVIGGLLLGLCVDLDLAFSGAVKLNSVVLTIVPPALLVVGLLLGLWAPVGRTRATPPRTLADLPTPVPWPESAPTQGDPQPTPPAPPPLPPTTETPPTTGTPPAG